MLTSKHSFPVIDCDHAWHRRDVTFLYKLVAGVCSKSYGMNVAGMAGVPSNVINMAEEKAHQFELATGFSASTTGSVNSAFFARR